MYFALLIVIRPAVVIAVPMPHKHDDIRVSSSILDLVAVEVGYIVINASA